MIAEIEDIKKKISQTQHQGISLVDFLCVMKEYYPLGNYMLNKFGWKSWYTFWHTKLFVSDEGGEYNFKYPFYVMFPNLLKRPFKIEIEHTTICNKECTFCGHTRLIERQEQMSLEKFKYIIDSIPSLKWLNIAGIGSTFLHKDFIKMLEYARQKYINVNFVDEFDLFDEEKARRVIELGVNSIFASFDAAKKETYERMKNGCSFERSINNIKKLLKLKEQMGSPFPVVHFRFVVTKINYREMPDYVEFVATLQNRGVRARLEFIGLITFPGIEEYYLPLGEIPKNIIIKVYENALKHNINLYFSNSDISCLPSMNRCVRWTEPFILVTGEVISDCAILMQGKRDFLKGISFGNAFETPFMEIWNSKRYRDFRKQVVTKNAKVPKSCVTCCAFNTADRIRQYGIQQ